MRMDADLFLSASKNFQHFRCTRSWRLFAFFITIVSLILYIF